MDLASFVFFVGFQLIHDLGSRMKIIDSNYKVINKNSDTIIAIVFIVINVILISGLSDKIYYH